MAMKNNCARPDKSVPQIIVLDFYRTKSIERQSNMQDPSSAIADEASAKIVASR